MFGNILAPTFRNYEIFSSSRFLELTARSILQRVKDYGVETLYFVTLTEISIQMSYRVNEIKTQDNGILCHQD
jgi:hypothetical protein